MSTFKVEVVPFKLDKHPNADTLSIAAIKGWQCIVKTEDFQNETLGVYIPIDAIAPEDHPLLGFLGGKKVKTIKLRQVISQGVLLPLKAVVDTYLLKKYPVAGDDLQEILGVKKYQPPANLSLRGNGTGNSYQVSEHPELQRYTDIEHFRNFPDEIKEGEPVVITEKLHGTSVRFALLDGQFHIGTRKTSLLIGGKYSRARTDRFVNLANRFALLGSILLRLGLVKRLEAKETVWHKVARTHNIEATLRKISIAHGNRNIILFGEIVGPKVQDLSYGQEEPSFFAYDLKIGDTPYLSPLEFMIITTDFGIKTVPILKAGPFELKDLELRHGKDTVSNSHVREGIVIEPQAPRASYELGRVILKVISEEYDMRKGGVDNEG